MTKRSGESLDVRVAAMSVNLTKPWQYDNEKLTTRGVSLFEYLVGLVIANAFKVRGTTPRRRIPPLLASLYQIAAAYDQRFDAIGNGEQRMDLTLRSPTGELLEGSIAIPAGWKDTFETDPVRALGHDFLRRARAHEQGGKRSGTVRNFDSKAEEVRFEAAKLEQRGVLPKLWIRIIARTVKCTPQYVRRVLGKEKGN
jgi:hypothetical protein